MNELDRDVRANRRDLLRAGAGLVVGSSLGLGWRPVVAQDRPLRWGSASLGSTGYVIIEALASTVSRVTDVKGASVATQGAVENMALLGRSELDLAQTTSLDWQPARDGEAPFKQKITPVQLLSYAVWNMHPLVRADSGLNRIEDLVGKRISPGPAGGITTVMWRQLFQKAGLHDKVRWTHSSWRETYDGFKAGAIDCIASILVDGKPSTIVSELETTVKLKPLRVEEALINEAAKGNPGAFAFNLTPENWKLIEAPMPTPSCSGIIGARPEMVSNEMGYKIVKAVYDNEEDIRRISKDLDMIRVGLATRYLLKGFPVNGGAARYYRERGVWREDLTATT
jgi:TRAP transporter TAXI family solute receptor